MKTRIGTTFAAAMIVLGVGYVAGIYAGEHSALRQIETVCMSQPDATLHSTIQSRAGIQCIYTNQSQYGRATRKQRAAKST